MMPKLDPVVVIVGTILEKLRDNFVDSSVEPLGGYTSQPQHRGGLLVALDGFGDDGRDTNGQCNTLLWAQVLRIYRARTFPMEELVGTPCGGIRVVQVQVGLARCAALPDENGNPPDPADLEREALVLLDDARRLELSLCQAAKAIGPTGRDVSGQVVIGAWEPVGPEGGVVSGVMTANFQLGG